MKIWHAYGSEHSMNLVMIGQFKDASDAAKAKQVIERLIEHVNAGVEAGRLKIGERVDRFPKDTLDLLTTLNIHTISSSELEQFAYDVTIEIDGNQVLVQTDEIDVSAFLKVFLDKGARVQVYSAHDYPDTGYGRGK